MMDLWGDDTYYRGPNAFEVFAARLIVFFAGLLVLGIIVAVGAMIVSTWERNHAEYIMLASMIGVVLTYCGFMFLFVWALKVLENRQ